MTDQPTEYEVMEPESVSAPPPRRKKPPARWLLPGFLLAVVVAGVVAWALTGGTGPVADDGPAPLVAAPEGPDKVVPDDPGGLDVPNQDKMVYEAMTGEEEAEAPEHLLPAAEEPAEEALAAAQDAAGAASDEAQNAGAAVEAADDALGGVSELAESEAAVVEPAAGEPAADMPVAEVPPEPAPEPAPAPAPAPEPVVVASAPAGDYVVQVGSFREESVARAEGERLKVLHGEIAGGLAVSVQRADLGAEKGVYYRARFGAFASREAADALCAQLKVRKQDCLVVKQ